MCVEKIQEKINALEYWDARVLSFECNYLGDEVKMTFGEPDRIDQIKFEECYKVVIEHDKAYKKDMPSRDLEFAQISYFLHDIKVIEFEVQGEKMYKTKIDMYPLDIEIHSEKIIV
ncbi:hypothetical protein PV797_15030 [Clostridiaceae bacterium M8S5]|nr:hypothetical protein PV797_15030 [Clostridiaceae bacterium M8S5]